jgi:hypothetical protein
LSIIHEERIDDTPKVVKGFKIYTDEKGEIIGAYLAEALKNANLVKEDSTLSFFNFEKNIYFYGFTLLK